MWRGEASNDPVGEHLLPMLRGTVSNPQPNNNNTRFAIIDGSVHPALTFLSSQCRRPARTYVRIRRPH